MSSVEVVTLRSGVRAIRHRPSGEVMHCGTGPAVESRAIYVEPSNLEKRLLAPNSLQAEGPLVLLDVGLGAASNALAAWRVSESLPASARRLEIVSFEWDLAPLELALTPEHASSFGFSTGAIDAHRAASSLASRGVYETARTTWRLVFGDIREAIGEVRNEMADIVFWDMYSREVDPELWSSEVFRALRAACRSGATVHTYSAATSTRSALLLADFAVGYGLPTGHKSHTTVAATRARDLERPLDGRFLVRLERSTAPFPTDVPQDAYADALAKVRAMPQFAV